MINKRLILASKSPRRYDLLSPNFDETLVVVTDVEEKYNSQDPDKIVQELARLKLSDLPQKYFDDIVVAGDTIVWYEGKLFGKPKDKADAFAMLKELSGKCHQVYSGYAVAYKGKVVVGCDKCDIIFKNLFCMLFAASAPQATYEYLLLTFAVATTLGSLRITCDSLFAITMFLLPISTLKQILSMKVNFLENPRIKLMHLQC